FIKIVNKGISKVETILKTVLTPHDPPEGLVENYILLIADKNISNFQKILDIKGIKKNEQQPSFLNNVPLAAAETKFNAVNIKKVLSGRNWRKKDGDGTKKEDDKV
ncbi:34239_t:CDS:2, partial [Racocetra persica]